MKRTKRYPPEVREMARRLLLEPTGDLEPQWAAIRSSPEKIA